MNAKSSAQSVLLFVEKTGTVLPYSTEAFQVSTGPKSRVIQRYSGALVVYRDGSVARLEGIQFLGLWGKNAWQRVFSFINGGTRQISVALRPLASFSFEEVRRLTVEYVHRHPEVIKDYFEQNVAPEAMLELLAKSSTCAELFDTLGVPEPRNALDSLT